MNKIFIYILSCLLFFSVLKAEQITNIIIEGNKRVSKETIKIYGKIDLKKDYKERDLDLVLKNLYSTDFFEDVKVFIDKGVLKINVKEYPFINQLIIVGEPKKSFLDQIKKVMKIKEKRPFIKSYLASDVDKIKGLYSSIGFNSSKVDAKLKKIDSESFDLLIEIQRGERTKISSITFIGNKNIRGSRLKDIIASEEDKFWKIISRNTNFNDNIVQMDMRLLTNYYKSLGFYDVKINSSLARINETGNVELTYSIEEGNRYTIKKISTNVDKVFNKDLFFPLNKSFKKYVGDYYSPFKVKKLLDTLDELIDKNNLQFVEHNVQEIVEGDTINIIFNVFEGEKNIVERINITGNTVTNEDVVRGELLLDEGDPFTKINLEKSISEIKARNIFKTVNYKVLDGSQNNLKVINIEVDEKPTGEISAGAGIGTSGGTFMINVKENNWLGQGKTVAFELDVDAESIGGEISVTDPNYNFFGNSLNYSIASIRNDKPDQGYENSIISAGIGTRFEQYRDIFASLGVYASFDDLSTTENASDSLKKQSGSFHEILANYGFTYDKRNRAFSPTSGSITRFGQSLPVYADKSAISNTFSSSLYKTFTEDLIGSGKIYVSTVHGLNSDVALSKRTNLSSRRLRGFERNKVGPVDGSDHVGGNYAASINFDANLPNFLPEDTNTDVSLFLDFGNVWGVDYDTSLDESNKIRSSTGIAANWMSPIGPLSFVISQNLSKADSDVTESFNFNLGTTF